MLVLVTIQFIQLAVQLIHHFYNKKHVFLFIKNKQVVYRKN